MTRRYPSGRSSIQASCPSDRHHRDGQRAAQSAAHCVDRGGADDRPRARDARRHPRAAHRRRRSRGAVERHLHRGLRDHGAEQLLARSRSQRPTRSRRRRRDGVGNVRTGRRAVFGKSEFATAVDPGARGGDQRSTGRKGRRTSSPSSVRTAPSSTTDSRRSTTSRSARRSRSPSSAERPGRSRSRASSTRRPVGSPFGVVTDLGRGLGRGDRRRRRTSTRS